MNQHSSHAPDHLLLLVQQVRSHYTEPLPVSKPGRPRIYSGLSFLLLAVVAVTLRTFKGLELQRLLEKDGRLRCELGFARVPHRRTIERRLSVLQPEAEAQVAALGRQIIAEVEPQDGLPVAASIDGRMYEALGPRWHQKQRKVGIIPRGLRNLDEESAWSKSGYRGWVQGYRLGLQCLVWPAPIPLFATWQPNNRGEGKVFATALENEQAAIAPILLGDESFGTPELVAAVRADGEWQAAVVGFHQLLKEPFCCGNITLRAEHEFDCASHGINGSVKILPLRADLHISLIEAIRRAAHLQVRSHTLIDLRGVALYPPENRHMIYSQPARSHHLRQVSVAQRVAAIPPDTQKDYIGRVVAPFKGGGGTLYLLT